MRWIIGDVHGMYRMLQRLLEAVHKRDPNPTFYFVGDYVNRGPESKQVIDLLISLENARFSRGNHDEIFDLVINGKCFESHPELYGPVQAFVSFLQFGLISTLTSYGIDLAMVEHVGHRPSQKAIENLIEPVPAEHRKFFASLPPFIEEPDLLVAHAKCDVDHAIDSPSIAKLAGDVHRRHMLMWGRYTETEIRRNKPWARTAYFGHTPVATYPSARLHDPHAPLFGPKIVLVDTGAALSIQGRLTAVSADESSYLQVNRSGEVLEG